MKKKSLLDLRPDARDSSPLYLQLARKLGQAIREGRFQADEALPSERVLSEAVDVSRVTARKAIDQLEEQGLIVRRRGSGNYIAPRIEQPQPLSRLTSFSEEPHERGYTPSSRWLKRGVTAAVPDEQLSLGLSPGARVSRLERLRLADDVVMAYEVSVLPENALPRPEVVEASLYEHLTSLGQAPVGALQHIRALNAQPRLAEQLGVPTGQAVLFISRIGYLESGQAVELTHSYCRSDYCDFVAEMRRDA
ncbi:MAG: GntR family transcriptional regulator [Burkholderiales bacterium]